MTKIASSLALLLALGGCGATKSAPLRVAAEPKAPVKESEPEATRRFDPARLASLADFVAAMRGHTFKRPLPPVSFVPQSRLPDVVGAQGPLRGFTTSGRYLADQHRIVIAERYENDPDLEPILVHELVHALMFDYGVTTPSLSSDDDDDLFARAARVEGEADLVEYAFRGKRDGRFPRRTMAGLTRIHEPFVPIGCRGESDPAACAFRAAIYSEGRVFASALYRAGGPRLLDAMHERPPTTTLEILYPDLYLRGIKSRELAELGLAVKAAGHRVEQRVHLGAFRLAETLARNDADAALTRAVLHRLRGTEGIALERGQLVVTEWADEEGAKRMLDLLATTKLRAVAVRPNRVVFGIHVTKDLVVSVATKLVPTAASTAVPSGAPIAAGPAPWEEELAEALRVEGIAGFRRAGIDANALRAETSSAGSIWLSRAGDKLFVFPTSVAAPNDRALTIALEKAWKGVAPPIELARPSRHATPIGEVPLWTSNFGGRSPLHFAIARVPLCEAPAAALMVVQFGASDTVKDALGKNLETLNPVPNQSDSPLCARLRAEAATDFTPPTF